MKNKIFDFKNQEIIDIFKKSSVLNNQVIIFRGWVKNIRGNKNLIFIKIKDGSISKQIQIICKKELISNFDEISKITIASAIEITGTFVLTPNNLQPFEVIASNIIVLALADPSYPLQKKEHSLEFLREIAHLRSNTSLFESVFRIRNAISFAIHKFFYEQNFVYIHSPIITTGDCEGAGECFIIKTQDNSEMFDKKAMLSVSGQLNAEAMALAFKKVYTFAPIFRAEKSNTVRHLAEFWMIEPEVAFCELNQIIDISYQLVKYVFKYILKDCLDELNILSQINNIDLIKRLKSFINSNYEIITYSKAIEILNEAVNTKKIKFENNNVSFGIDFNIEHEKYLCDVVYKKPIYIINYPKSFKAFYMKSNSDNLTVASFDLLVPEIGELIGGSERESDANKLLARAKELKLGIDSIKWYLELRKYGYFKSAGFGLGFERLIMYITGVTNIRDTILFPRAYGKINF